MFKILHFSDLHLEMPFKTSQFRPSYGTWRRQDLRATLGRILTVAREKKVDVITIAGDLFEQDYILPEFAGFLSTQFSKVKPIRVIIAPGEKDPCTTESIYSVNRWPENVTILNQNRLTKLKLTDEITLWGAACPPRKDRKLFEINNLDDLQINILLIHAQLREDKSGNLGSIHSLNLSDIHEAGFRLGLLGSSHRTKITQNHSSICIIPGSPELLEFEPTNGSHNIILIRIENKKCTPELIPINQWHYISHSLDITKIESEDQVINSLEKFIKNLALNKDERRVIKVILTGTPEFALDVQRIISKLDSDTYLEIVVDMPYQYNLDFLAQEQTVRGTLVRMYLERLNSFSNDQERDEELNALNYCLQALEGKRIRQL